MLGQLTRSVQLDSRRSPAGFATPAKGFRGALGSFFNSGGLAAAARMWDPGPIPIGGVEWTGDGPWRAGMLEPDEALSIAVAYQCHALVTDSVGMLPTFARRYNSPGVTERLWPTPEVLANPFPLITPMAWKSQMASSLLWWGNAYALPFDRDSDGHARQLAPIHPDWVEVHVDRAGLPVYEMTETGVTFNHDEFFHVRGHTLPGQPVGFGILDVASGTFRAAAAQRDYTAGAFSSGVPSGIIRVQRPEIAEEEAMRLKARWMSTFSGPTREPAVMPNSMDFEPLSMSPVDADLAALRRLSARDVCHYFGVHPGLIGEDTGASMCADTDTEILTRDGWKRYDELTVGDDIRTLNHDTGMAEWQPVQKVNVFEVTDRAMIRMDSVAHSSFTTDDHRWPVLSGDRSEVRERRWKLSRELSGHDRIVIAAPSADTSTEAKYTDAFVELVAWWTTEGHTQRRPNLVGRYAGQVAGERPAESAGLAQSAKVNPENVERIRAALRALIGEPRPTRSHQRNKGLTCSVAGCDTPAKVRGMCQVDYHQWRKAGGVTEPVGGVWWTDTPQADGMVSFRLSPEFSKHLFDVMDDADRKVVSLSFLQQLTQSQLELFINVSVLADGWSGDTQRTFKQHDDDRLVRFEVACVLAGVATNRHNNTSSVTVKHRSLAIPTAGTGPVSERFTGTVWCPTVANASWLARRNGTTYFTGNTYSNVESQWTGLLRYSIQPWTTRLQEALTNVLPRSTEVRFDFDELLQPTTVERFKAWAQAIDAGILTVDEVRERENLPPMPGDAPPAEIDITQAVQKVYSGVGTVLTPAEARTILNQYGANLDPSVDPTPQEVP